MRAVLTLFAAAAATLAFASVADAQQRYLTWPGKVETPGAAAGPSAPMTSPAARPAWAGAPADTVSASPTAGDRYGPRRTTFPQPAYAPRPVAAPVERPAPYPIPASTRSAQPTPRYAPSPRPEPGAARRPTIYDAGPIADTPMPAEAAPEPRDVAMAAPAAAAQPAPAPAPAASQPWTAGSGEGQGSPSRRYSVQREVAQTTWGPEVAARYGNPQPAPAAPAGR